jgi:exonuclease SbcD
LPEDLLAVYGIDPAGLDPRTAWRQVVERAIEGGVDAVLLAGDVVESSNGFMEAYGALHEGVERLAAESIEVIAVAGNHDVEVLPRLADEIESFHLLGRRGTWQSRIVRRDGEPLVRVLGWSFPKTHVESSPLDAMSASFRAGRYDDDAQDDLRTVGLLHCDLDASGSRYAPVTTKALAHLSTNISAWFLGHIHIPSIGVSGRPMGYLGSLVSLKPTDLGARGPWMARAMPGRWELEQIALSPLRWEDPVVPIDDCENAEAVESMLIRVVTVLAEKLAHEMDGTRVVGLRPRLVGRTKMASGEVRRAMALAGSFQSKIDGAAYFVDKVADETSPALNLEFLAQGNDPAALVASSLLALQANEAAGAKLVAEARERLEKVARHPNFSRLGGTAPDDESVRQLLLRTASRALGELLAQKNTSSPSVQADEVLA